MGVKRRSRGSKVHVKDSHLPSPPAVFVSPLKSAGLSLTPKQNAHSVFCASEVKCTRPFARCFASLQTTLTSRALNSPLAHSTHLSSTQLTSHALTARALTSGVHFWYKYLSRTPIPPSPIPHIITYDRATLARIASSVREHGG